MSTSANGTQSPVKQLIAFDAGNYSYLPNAFQYSASVIAQPGFEIVRARFSRLLGIEEGFAAIKSHLERSGRPLTALCACELRSPGQMSEPDFIAFNRGYVKPLTDWGLFRDEMNPVGRCNLAPEADPPTAPGFYGFSYTTPMQSGIAASFVVSGAADCPDGVPNYRPLIVRYGDTSPDGMRDKVRFALGDIESRLSGMGVGWSNVTDTNLYTVHDVRPLLADEFVRRGAMPGGLTWHYCRPPVVGLDIELDCRATAMELFVMV
ncbi:hypothetical protein BH09PSE5_BH09PSE5_45350 [soil metagenome]